MPLETRGVCHASHKTNGTYIDSGHAHGSGRVDTRSKMMVRTTESGSESRVEAKRNEATSSEVESSEAESSEAESSEAEPSRVETTS